MTVTIGRRELLAALGGTAVAWPLAARAQQTPNKVSVGFLSVNTRSAMITRTDAFQRGLGDLGTLLGRILPSSIDLRKDSPTVSARLQTNWSV